MTYLTFRTSKGSVFIPRLVQCLSIAADILLLSLLAWNVTNLFYPVLSWITVLPICAGFFTSSYISWIIGRFRIRSFIAAKFRLTDQNTSEHPNRLKYLGYMYSVWETSESLILGYYDCLDRIYCSKKRLAVLHCESFYSKWLGWIVILVTDAIPFAVLALFICAGYFFGVGSIVSYTMGLILALQVESLHFFFRKAHCYWQEDMSLDGKMCKSKSLGLMTCVLEGPDGELFLTLTKVAEYEHYERRHWFDLATWKVCACCTSTTCAPPSETSV